MIRVCYREEIISLGDSNVQTMCSLLSMKPGEYSYFSPRTMKMWAGPDHWRFRPRPKREYLWVGLEDSAVQHILPASLQSAGRRDAAGLCSLCLLRRS